MDKRKLAREKLLFRYSAALERGDFTTVDAVLRAAGRDPLLEEMLLEVNAVYADERSSGFSRQFDPVNTNTQEAQHTMAASIALNRGARSAPSSTRNPVNLLSMAAVIVVVAFTALIVSRLPPGSTGTDGSFGGGANLDPANQVNTTIDCTLPVSASSGATVYSRPQLDARVLATLEQGTEVRVVEFVVSIDPSPIGGAVRWVYVEAGRVGGWVQFEQVEITNNTCPELTPADSSVPVPLAPGGVPALATPVPFQPDNSNPPPGQYLPTLTMTPGGAGDLMPTMPPTVVPPSAVEQCSIITDKPVSVYATFSVMTSLLTLEAGIPIAIISQNTMAERYQINTQLGDMLLVGGWIDMNGVNIGAACASLPIGDRRPPVDSLPPAEFLATVTPPLTATPSPVLTATPTLSPDAQPRGN